MTAPILCGLPIPGGTCGRLPSHHDECRLHMTKTKQHRADKRTAAQTRKAGAVAAATVAQAKPAPKVTSAVTKGTGGEKRPGKAPAPPKVAIARVVTDPNDATLPI